MNPRLTVVTDAPETRATRRARLVAEIAAMDREAVRDIGTGGADFCELLEQVAASHHKPGVCDIARRLAEKVRADVETMVALAERRA
jgi:hypothetical protein